MLTTPQLPVQNLNHHSGGLSHRAHIWLVGIGFESKPADLFELIPPLIVTQVLINRFCHRITIQQRSMLYQVPYPGTYTHTPLELPQSAWIQTRVFPPRECDPGVYFE